MLAAVYLERKFAAFIQDRLGPMEVGYKGTLQTFADLLKLLQKEIIIPGESDKKLFLLAPVWILITVLASFAVIPVNNTWLGATTHIGLLYIFAMISLKVVGILLAGWSSNNKFARLGALRAIAQFFAYEIPLGLSILCVVIVSRSLDLATISSQQGLEIYNLASSEFQPSYLLGIKGINITHLGGIFTWNIFRIPSLAIAYTIYFISSLAVSNKIPFDLAESESELIAGYQTEYSGLYWAWLMLAEYAILFLMALLGVILFLGSWNTPLPNLIVLKLALYTNSFCNTWLGATWSSFWLFSKTMMIILIQMWIKWSFPRLRTDQLVKLCWLYLTPVALITLLITLWWQFIIL